MVDNITNFPQNNRSSIIVIAKILLIMVCWVFLSNSVNDLDLLWNAVFRTRRVFGGRAGSALHAHPRSEANFFSWEEKEETIKGKLQTAITDLHKL